MSNENIRVAVRFRPINAREMSEEVSIDVEFHFLDNQTVEIRSSSLSQSERMFRFDEVFPPDTTQEEFYNRTCKPVVDDVLRGYNGTIFAYGQTGAGMVVFVAVVRENCERLNQLHPFCNGLHNVIMAGKSWSMMGDLSDPEKHGIIPRASAAVFDLIERSEDNIEFKVSCSYLEIYNEQIQDLFDPSKRNLRIHESIDRGVFVADLTTEYVGSEQDIYDLLEVGSNNRVVSFTKMNAVSSRSHSVFTINVQQVNLETGSVKTGKLNLVDLAGSEKVGKTGATGQTLEEAKKINQSLSSLGNCINALVEGKPHVPFRDSRLTRILQQSLGGNSKTTIVCAASPHPFNIDETLSTLKFGSRAKSIKCKVKVNAQKSAKELQRIVDELQKQLRALKSQNKALLGQITSLGVTPDVSDGGIDGQDLEPNAAPDDGTGEDASPMEIAEMKLELENARVRYENELQKLQEELEELQSEDKSMRSLVATLQKQLEETEEEMELLLEEQEKFETIKQDMLKKFEYEKQVLQMDLEEAILQIEELETVNNELEQELQELKDRSRGSGDGDLAGRVRRNASESPEDNDVSHIADPRERGKAMFELFQLRELDKEHRVKIDRLNEKLTSMQAELEKLRACNVELETKLERMAAQHERHKEKSEKELERISTINSELETSKEQADVQLMELETELTKLLNEADHSDHKQAELKNEIASTQAKIDAKEVDIMKLKLHIKKNSLGNSSAASEELEAFFIQEFENAMQELRESHASVETQLTSEIDHLRAELEDERAQAALIQREFQTRLDKLQKELDEKTTEMAEMADTIETLHELEDAVIHEMNDLRLAHETERNSLKSKFDDEQHERQLLVERVSKLEKEVEQLYIEREELKSQSAATSQDQMKKTAVSGDAGGRFTGGLASMANELMELRLKFQESDTQRTRLEDEANKSRRVIASERSKLRAAQSRCDHQKARILELERELETMRINSTYRAEERESSKKKRQELEAKVAELEKALEAMQKSAAIRRSRVFVPVKSSGAIRRRSGVLEEKSSDAINSGDLTATAETQGIGPHMLRKTGRSLS